MATEVGEAISEIAHNLPERTQRELLALISSHLALARIERASPASRIGLLLYVLERGEGQVPSVIDYDRENAASTDEWPSGSQLSRDFGGWIQALRAAVSLATGKGTSRRLPPGSSFSRRPYRREEAVAALLKFRAQVGDWPSSDHEYARWATVARTIQLRWGDPEARLPSMNVIDRQFGSLDRAISCARDTWGSEEVKP